MNQLFRPKEVLEACAALWIILFSVMFIFGIAGFVCNFFNYRQPFEDILIWILITLVVQIPAYLYLLWGKNANR